ncbi:hypothetical protein JD844_005813 [Phrynosoma platyrhinos]|uniref:Potassium channel tetramerisation-type BTB domain-containing protein n=1 Tax=Phrynosoma platyrhinos TaxID=52577 RepID=A0ABQ7TP46_PHRPL|nr:hypothetical protein JD844_005813 [Phrynosoma platyrhinos]
MAAEAAAAAAGAELIQLNVQYVSSDPHLDPGFFFFQVPQEGRGSLLSGRISTLKDETGAIFIDRDPEVFAPILNFLRTKELDIRRTNISLLLHEAQFYGITPLGTANDPGMVRLVCGHHNWIAVAYAQFLVCYRMKETSGWQLVFCSPRLDWVIERVALNARVLGGSLGDSDKMVAAASCSEILLWALQSDGNGNEIGVFHLGVPVEGLFFVGSQLIATSHTGKIGVWNAVTKHWQTQEMVPINSYDAAGSFLLLGCNNGSIYYVDVQKFPLRMKDNDLLVTELYRDPSEDAITALSVYLTPKCSDSGNWIEIAYGTSSGMVRVIVKHPETVGSGPQLFQTFAVHRSPVTKVMLSERHLISVCADNNHVRTWTVTRFRGMISTQPGSTPLASFKILALESMDGHGGCSTGTDIGPFGERDDQQVFLQKVVPDASKLYVRLSSTGKRVCEVCSVDGSPITAFMVQECEGSSRIGSRPRRYLFTGHSNGSLQMWDLTTAMEMVDQVPDTGGLSEEELLQELKQCDLALTHTLEMSPAGSFSPTHLPSAASASSLQFQSVDGAREKPVRASPALSCRLSREPLTQPDLQQRGGLDRRRQSGSFIERCQELARCSSSSEFAQPESLWVNRPRELGTRPRHVRLSASPAVQRTPNPSQASTEPPSLPLAPSRQRLSETSF